MGKFEGMLLVSDFDNTLLYTEKALKGQEACPAMPERNVNRLRYWMEEGGRFAVATGRAMSAFRPYAAMVPSNSPAVVDNGGGIYDFRTDEYLVASFLPLGAREHIRAAAQAFPGISLELYHADGLLQCLNPTDWNRQHAKMADMALTVIGDLEEGTVAEPITKALFLAQKETLEDICALAEAQGWRGEYELIYSSDHLLEMTARGANKGEMVKHLAKELGCSTLICAGDHLNDIPMLEAAHRAFCPENALEPVKARCERVVCHCLEGAVGELIEILDREL